MPKQRAVIVNDVKSWANGVIRGETVPKDAIDQFIKAEDLRTAHSFKAFRNALIVYKNASTHISEVYSQALIITLARDSAICKEYIAQTDALKENQNSNKASSPESLHTIRLIIPSTILNQINEAYLQALRGATQGNYREYRSSFVERLAAIPAKVEANLLPTTLSYSSR